MSSQANLEKKRIALVGNKRKSDDKEFSEDIVSEILKSMESKTNFCKEYENLKERHSPCSSTPILTASSVKPRKKYLLHKKHPLMEKCQKNLKYLKHNRSIPKQRAHVAEIGISNNIVKTLNLTTNSNTFKVIDEKKKAKIISKKVKKCNSSPQNEEENSDLQLSNSIKKQIEVVSKDSSDTDCDFEEFIRVQKHSLDFEDTDSEIESATSRRMKKKRKILKCNTRKSKSSVRENLVNNRVLDKTSGESDSEMDEPIYSDSDCSDTFKTSRLVSENSGKKNKQRGVKFNRKKSKSIIPKKLVESSTPNKTSEDSVFERNESICYNSDSSETIVANPHLELNNDNKNNTSVHSNLLCDLTNVDNDCTFSKKFSCVVRVERNPILDEKAISSFKKDIKDLSSNKNQSKFTHDLNEKSIKMQSSSSGFNSDEDECSIICEVPRSDSTSTDVKKSREPVLHKDSLSDTGSKIYPNLGFKSQDKSSHQLEDSPGIEILSENFKNCTVKSENESEIQILSVESLNIHLNDKDCFENNKPNKEKQEQIASNLNFSHVGHLEDQYNTDCSENKTTLDPMLAKKDFFKYAKSYSEPQNLIDNNAQVITKDSEVTFMSNPKINECLDKIDLKLLNSTIKQDSCSTYFDNNCDNSVLDNTVPSMSLDSSKHFNCDQIGKKLSTSESFSETCIQNTNPLPSYILEIAQKIDFEKALSLSKFEQNKNRENRVDQSMTSINDSTTNAECNQMKNSHHCVVTTNTNHSCVLPPTEANNNQEKLALLNKFDIQSVESCSQMLNKNTSDPTHSFKTKVEKYIESPSDELDVIAAANILDLNELKSKDFLPLFHLYIKELTKYKSIKSAEQNFSEGLKILEETQLEKLKYLDKAIQSVLQHDPCSLKVIDKAKLSKTDPSVRCDNLSLCKQETLNKYKEQSILENTKSTNRQAEICSNCGLLAKLKCLGCEKVYFCSEKCGLKFWKEGHADSCQKDSSQVKMEK